MAEATKAEAFAAYFKNKANQARGNDSAGTFFKDVMRKYDIESDKFDVSVRLIEFENDIADRVAEKIHELRTEDIARGGTGDIEYENPFESDRLTAFYKDQLEEVIGNVKGMSRDMLKTQIRRMEVLMDGMSQMNMEEAEFLMREYQESIKFMEDKFKEQSKIMVRSMNFMSTVASEYFDIRSLYAGFVQNNPIAMGVFNLASKFIENRRRRKEEERTLVESDLHRQMIAKKYEEEEQKRIQKESQRQAELETIKPGSVVSEPIPTSRDIDIPDEIRAELEKHGVDIEQEVYGSKPQPKVERVRPQVEKQSVAEEVRARVMDKSAMLFERENAKETKIWQDKLYEKLIDIEDVLKDMTGKFGAGGSDSGGFSLMDLLAGRSLYKGLKNKLGSKFGRLRKGVKLPGGGSTLSRVGKVAGKVGGRVALPLAGALAGYDEYQEGGSATSVAASAGGSMAGMAAGALAGQALIPIPILGAIIGGIGGSMLGEAAISSLLGDSEKEKQANLLIRDMEKRGVIDTGVMPWSDYEIDDTRLSELGVRELKALLLVEKFNAEDTKKIQAELEKKQAEMQGIRVETSDLLNQTPSKIVPKKLAQPDYEKAIESMEQSGILDRDWIGDSEIEAGRLNELNTTQLSALLQMEDLDSEDEEKVKQVLSMKQKVEKSKEVKKKEKTNTLQNRNNRKSLGFISAKYESRGDAGTVSTGRGDAGGVSYGKYQLSSSRGSVQAFLKANPQYVKQFEGLKPGSPEFNAKWKEVAKSDPNFGQAQHDYIKSQYYDKQVAKLADAGMDLSGRGGAVQEAIWSTSVQYGANTSLIQKALKDQSIDDMTDEQIISAIQDYKAANVNKNFRSSSFEVRRGVANRIAKEKKDLLAYNKSQMKMDVPIQAGMDKKIAVIEDMKQSIDREKEQAKVAMAPQPAKPSVKRVTSGSDEAPPSVNVGSARNSDSSVQRITDRYISHGMA